MKKFIRHLHKIIFATKHNNYRPHILKETGALFVIGLFIGLLYFASAVKEFALTRTNMLAEVYPAIIASLTNQGREENALNTLTYNLKLEIAAKKKAEDMIAQSYFAHIGPSGKRPWDWIKEAGYEYEYAGENLAINFSDSADVHTAWMNSPGHKANILNKNYMEIGVATLKTMVNGKESVIVVQMFGQPKIKVLSEADILLPEENLGISDINDTDNLFEEDKLVSNEVLLAFNDITQLPEQVQRVQGIETKTEVLAVGDIAPATTTIIPDGESLNLGGTASFIDTSGEPEGQGTEPVITTKSQNKALLYELMASPRSLSMFIYVIFMIILNLAVISFGFVQYRHHHKKAIFIALLLVLTLSLISLLYMYQNTPSVIL